MVATAVSSSTRTTTPPIATSGSAGLPSGTSSFMPANTIQSRMTATSAATAVRIAAPYLFRNSIGIPLL